MRIPKRLLGKSVEITWLDPKWDRVSGGNVPKGRAALATWHEYGIIDDVTEGVVRLVHSAGAEGSRTLTVDSDYVCTWIPEALIEKVISMSAMKTYKARRGVK